MGVSKSGFVVLSIGTVILVGGATREIFYLRLILALLGFATVIGGFVIVYMEEVYARKYLGERTFSKQYVRLFGASVVFASTFLPYLPIPLEYGATRDAYSYIGLLNAIRLGADIEGGLTLLIFVGVVFAGASLSLLHYTGGYVVLFGITGYGYVASILLRMDVTEVILTEFRTGMYAAATGAFIVILSSFFRYCPEETERKDIDMLHRKRASDQNPRSG